MQSNTIFLIALVIMLAYAIRRNSPHGKRPVWSVHLACWQKVFGLAGFLVALVIVLNPEFWALGLLGDAALFDVLVLALSLQLRSIAFTVWHFVHIACCKVCSWMVRRAQLDYVMVLVAVASIWNAVVSVGRFASKYLHPHQRLLAW